MVDYRGVVLAGDQDDAQKRGDSSTAAAPSRTDERRAAAERRTALAPLRKRLEAVEARMTKLTGAIAKVDAALGDGTAFLTDPAKASDLSRMRAEAAAALASAEEEWLALSGEIEAAGA
jgi:ATP-binding cassette subfamily F protein 3